MAKDSAIEWCDHTFNPWWGCVKVSEGCKNCYAEARQFDGDWWGKDKPRRFFGEKHWEQPRKWNEEAGKLGIRHKVFCGSYCDVFEEREDLKEAQNKLGQLIKFTFHLDWLLLTKRPENIESMLLRFGFVTGEQIALNRYGLRIYIPNNVWLGVSVENQKQADIRIPQLLKIPAKVRFLSCEPLLEEIDLTKIHDTANHAYFDILGKQRFDYGANGYGVAAPMQTGVHWVIVGGESGSNARPMNPDWSRSIRDQCREAGVEFFMKQMNKIDPIPDDLFIRQFPEVV